MHTPGPWEAKPQSPSQFVAWDVFAIDEPNGYICTTSGNAKENAKLIAASPDMKELIKTIYDGIHRGVGPMASASDAEIGHWIQDEMCKLLGNDWND